MKVLILGSKGQIGDYLTNFLRNKGYTVFEFDIVNDKSQDLTVIPNKDLNDIIRDTDFVFFLAFDVGGSHYLKKYQHTFNFINNNARILVNTFNYLNKYNKPFIFASSQMSSMSYSPYGAMKRLGELYSASLNGLIVKFWNVYGLERDMEKAHVITDFIKKGFKNKEINMMTDGTEEREFLYAEDCCEALEIIMTNYNKFSSYDDLHITSFESITILEIGKLIQSLFKDNGIIVKLISGDKKDDVQKDARNEPDNYIEKWWKPRTSIKDGISKVFKEMKKNLE